jgi:hypothetical protein
MSTVKRLAMLKVPTPSWLSLLCESIPNQRVLACLRHLASVPYPSKQPLAKIK